MSSDSNPGSATPCSLYKLYASRAAATANPYTLRAVQRNGFPTNRPLELQGLLSSNKSTPQSRQGNSPPRASFKLLTAPRVESPGLQLSLTSLGGPKRQ